MTKKQIRAVFRQKVLQRDHHQCKMCGKTGPLDVHHITDRNEMPNGGYVEPNGISLCPICHKRAEAYHISGECDKGFHPSELYALIGSDYQRAYNESLKLNQPTTN